MRWQSAHPTWVRCWPGTCLRSSLSDGQSHCDGEPAGSSGAEREGSVVCLSDALDDRQAKAHPRIVPAGASSAALKRLGECRDQLWTELVAGVLDHEHDGLGAVGGADLHAAVLGDVVDDRIVQKVRSQLQQECV